MEKTLDPILVRKAVWITSKLLQILKYYDSILNIINHLTLTIILHADWNIYSFKSRQADSSFKIVRFKKIHLRILYLFYVSNNSEYFYTLDWALSQALYRYYLIRSSQQSWGRYYYYSIYRRGNESLRKSNYLPQTTLQLRTLMYTLLYFRELCHSKKKKKKAIQRTRTNAYVP